MIKRILSLTVGEMRSKIYFVEGENGKSLMIDCGASDSFVSSFIEKNSLSIGAVLLTHGHFDHIGGLDYAEKNAIDVYIGEYDAPMLSDDYLNLSTAFCSPVPHIKKFKKLPEGEVEICGFKVNVIHTPGHTAGSVCYLIENELFSGDTMFFETFGRCDLPTSDKNAMLLSLKKLCGLDENVRVYPGHGAETTVKHEKDYYGF